jgi:hypothetical protein
MSSCYIVLLVMAVAVSGNRNSAPEMLRTTLNCRRAKFGDISLLSMM